MELLVLWGSVFRVSSVINCKLIQIYMWIRGETMPWASTYLNLSSKQYFERTAFKGAQRGYPHFLLCRVTGHIHFLGPTNVSGEISFYIEYALGFSMSFIK